MRRRDFIALVGGVTIWPRGVHAQQSGRVPRIGLLVYGGEAEFGRFVAAFRVGMAERGYQDGKNVQYEVRYSEQDLREVGSQCTRACCIKRRRDLGAGLYRRAGRARGDDSDSHRLRDCFGPSSLRLSSGASPPRART